jgi:RNA polymerase sigma factor (sigma-70 family)
MQQDLVERARRGDQEAFAALVVANTSHCYALAFRILRDQQRAEDAAQQALLGAWRDLPNLREPERFDSWLQRLVVHACYTEARRDRRWTARIRLISADGPQDLDTADSVALRDELDRGFRRLSTEQRTVVVLHHYVGYQLTEIADVLGIPVGTVRSRLHYATRQLRAAIEADARPTPKERTA